MTEIEKETPTLLFRRTSPIEDEVLESCVSQLTRRSNSDEASIFFYELDSIDQVKNWTERGNFTLVADAISKYQIPDQEARVFLSEALGNNPKYLRSQPMYPEMKDQVKYMIELIENMAKRLRGQDF